MIEKRVDPPEGQRLAQENQVKMQRISTLHDVARALSHVKMERLLRS